MAIKTYSIPEVGFVQISGAKTKEYLIPEGGFLNEGGISYTADLTSGCDTTASGSYPGGTETPPYAIDDSTATQWTGYDGAPFWWQIEFAEAKKIRKLTITAGADFTGRMPKAFTLKASAASDMSGSVPLVDVSALPDWSALEKREWEFENGTTYDYYRITITDTKDATPYPRLPEVEMMEEAEEEEEEEEPAYGGLFFCHG